MKAYSEPRSSLVMSQAEATDLLSLCFTIPIQADITPFLCATYISVPTPKQEFLDG